MVRCVVGWVGLSSMVSVLVFSVLSRLMMNCVECLM